MSRKKTERRVADPIVKRRIVVTPEAGETWYWLCDAGATITDRSNLIAHTGSKSAPRYQLFWDYDLALEYRDDLGGCRWREDWMEYIAGIEPYKDKNDPLVFRQYLIRYRPSIFDSIVCQSRLGIYAYARSGKFRVIQMRRSLPEAAGHNREEALYAPEILATVVGHLVEHCVPGIDKRTMIWLVRYGVPPRRGDWDHHFYWQLMHCEWDCLEGEWWVTGCEFEEAPSHVIHNILWG